MSRPPAHRFWTKSALCLAQRDATPTVNQPLQAWAAFLFLGAPTDLVLKCSVPSSGHQTDVTNTNCCMNKLFMYGRLTHQTWNSRNRKTSNWFWQVSWRHGCASAPTPGGHPQYRGWRQSGCCSGKLMVHERLHWSSSITMCHLPVIDPCIAKFM